MADLLFGCGPSNRSLRTSADASADDEVVPDGEEEFYVSQGVVEESHYTDSIDSIRSDAATLQAPGRSDLGKEDITKAMGRMDSKVSRYEQVSVEDAELMVSAMDFNPAQDDKASSALIWYVKIFPDGYDNPKHALPNGHMKPRRPIPQAHLSHLMTSLVKISNGRYVFGGILNGWPGLTGLELRSITAKPRAGLAGIRRLTRCFDANRNTGTVPTTKAELEEFSSQFMTKFSVRASFAGPKWSSKGWSAQSPGRVFWYDSMSPDHQPQVLFGRDIVAAARNGENPKAMSVHLFGHRYAKLKETMKDRITYHSGVLIDWDHGRHCTIIELAWLNGLSGYNGKSNFMADRDAPRTRLYAATPDCMKAPYINSLSEIRVLDIEAKNKGEFMDFLVKHTGVTGRFLEPKIPHSGRVKLPYSTQADIFSQLVNYALANPDYYQESRNCQTFACDFYRHLTADYSVEPYHPVVRPFYICRSNLFLYPDTPDFYGGAGREDTNQSGISARGQRSTN